MAVCVPMGAPGKVVGVNAFNDLAALTAQLMQSRQTILPKRLMDPGPDVDQLRRILEAASFAPDHGQLLPWRFIVVPQEARTQLAAVFGAALLERDAQATPEQVAQAQEKAHRGPTLLLMVVDAARGGCAVQNMLLMATAMGYGSALTSGKALKSAGLRTLFALQPGDHALCFVSMGTVQSRKKARLRPSPVDYVTTLSPQGPGVAQA
jgi:nitroreductase